MIKKLKKLNHNPKIKFKLKTMLKKIINQLIKNPSYKLKKNYQKSTKQILRTNKLFKFLMKKFKMINKKKKKI